MDKYTANRIQKFLLVNQARARAIEQGLHYHHTSLRRGYVKTPDVAVSDYSGYFGEGVAIEFHTSITNGFHLIEYWTSTPPTRLRNPPDGMEEEHLALRELYIQTRRGVPIRKRGVTGRVPRLPRGAFVKWGVWLGYFTPVEGSDGDRACEYYW